MTGKSDFISSQYKHIELSPNSDYEPFNVYSSLASEIYALGKNTGLVKFKSIYLTIHTLHTLPLTSFKHPAKKSHRR